MTKQQERKQYIRAFMRAHYTDERLAQLLAHAEDEKLSYTSCCCFIGIVTADHALRSDHRASMWDAGPQDHYRRAQKLDFERRAENAYQGLASLEGDPKRRRILIPIIRAEMRRRALTRQEVGADARVSNVEV